MSSKTGSLIILLLLALLIGGCYAPPDTVTVIKVIDGDTIVIEGGYRVRYIGIDTPEIRPREEAYAIEAWQANRQMVEGKRVRLEKDVSETDRYDRLLRYVYVEDFFVNAELVRVGLARVISYPPDTRYQSLLEEVEDEARRAGRGIWGR
ncbi:thermonuclease family protein [Chloroflexota bacterium]